MRDKINLEGVKECSKTFLTIMDTMELLSGKWKIPIVGVLLYKGKQRFMDLTREVDGIAAKMLSKELHDLEINQLLKRTVCDTKPVTVEYEITAYGRTLENLMAEIMKWGTNHRKKITNKLEVIEPSQSE